MSDDNNGPTTEVEQGDNFARLSVTSTRGTGTRDQDKAKLTVQKGSLAELAAEREDMIDELEATLSDAREMNVDEGDDGGDGDA